MGILPLEYASGDTAASLGLTGEETFSFDDLASAIPDRKLKVRVLGADGKPRDFTATVRIDTPQEREYYRHGGILQYVLRQLLRG
jgi:aconitate hydratase